MNIFLSAIPDRWSWEYVKKNPEDIPESLLTLALAIAKEKNLNIEDMKCTECANIDGEDDSTHYYVRFEGSDAHYSFEVFVDRDGKVGEPYIFKSDTTE